MGIEFTWEVDRKEKEYGGIIVDYRFVGGMWRVESSHDGNHSHSE
jgi:hypothetical protein